MPITNDGLKKEFEYVTRPGERKHIGETLDQADEFMQEMAYALITGKHLENRPAHQRSPGARLCGELRT